MPPPLHLSRWRRVEALGGQGDDSRHSFLLPMSWHISLVIMFSFVVSVALYPPLRDHSAGGFSSRDASSCSFFGSGWPTAMLTAYALVMWASASVLVATTSAPPVPD
jgi:hypothetical protein